MLIRRISNLEQRIADLSVDCERITEHRSEKRWDGFVASAEAPTAAALRLAQKNRLAELDSLANEQHILVRDAQTAYDNGKQATETAIEAELDAREKSRSLQRDLAGAHQDRTEPSALGERGDSEISRG